MWNLSFPWQTYSFSMIYNIVCHTSYTFLFVSLRGSVYFYCRCFRKACSHSLKHNTKFVSHRLHESYFRLFWHLWWTRCHPLSPGPACGLSGVTVTHVPGDSISCSLHQRPPYRECSFIEKDNRHRANVHISTGSYLSGQRDWRTAVSRNVLCSSPGY